MADPAVLRCEVAYARPDRQWVVSVSLQDGATALDALKASTLSAACPEIVPEQAVFGIFGKVVSGNQRLRDGDRVEIYRPLSVDPRAARRAKVKGRNPRR